jgi:hypothetical protein
MRWYLPNIARFPSVDPLTAEYPWYTPYQFAGNMPIIAIDLDGLEPWFNHKDKQGFAPKIETVNNKTIIKSYMPYEKTSTWYKVGGHYQETLPVQKEGTYLGAFNSNETALLHRTQIINRHAREILAQNPDNEVINGSKLENGRYGTLDDKRYCAYDCITTFIAGLELLSQGSYRKYNTNGEMQTFLNNLHKKGLAGTEVSAIANKLGGFKMGESFSDKINASILGKKGVHVFGISINGSYHSATLVVDNMNDNGTEAGTNITYKLYDQTSWNGESLTATALDKLLGNYSSKHQSTEDGIKAREIFKPTKNKK